MSDRAIQEAVEKLSGTHLSDKVYFIDAEIVSVDKLNRNCIVQAVGGKRSNQFTARLMATLDDGILIIPAPGSSVVVLRSEFTVPAIVQYSEVDEIILRGGDLGGLVKIINLTQKLNNFVTEINTELTKIQVAITALSGTYIKGTLSNFNKTDYENDTITHG